MYRELKEMKNRYIAGSVGTEEPVEGDDADWQAALYMGERLDVPEGPVILTRDAFERRQESQKEALVRYSRAPRGILKRPREEDGEQTAKSPSPSTLTEFGDDFEEPDIELTTLEQYRRLGIPPPRKKVRADGSSTSSDVTWLLQRVSNVTPRPLQKGDSPGLSSKDRAVSATCGDVMSPSRLQLGDGLDFTPPSLRALSFWRSTLMGMVNR
ncbi:hypothetical protein SERLA73DRAFT_131690 [Serpula lacrymans var. lacrymans S7.3]|uniref:Uncharacterized protein n=2 Tax=Serpula lacrymans var. lacrymans TaxID=341189 RepID=F8PPR8_SERL3|nr:hypothetical protein SERLA73DRAFT_131690 [Serpula lacrymans var. lacrymans S7.3]